MWFRLRRAVTCCSKQIALRGMRRCGRFQIGQTFTCAANHGGGHTGELRNLQPVTAAGRSFLYDVQEHDAILVFDGIQMHVHHLFEIDR